MSATCAVQVSVQVFFLVFLPIIAMLCGHIHMGGVVKKN